LKQDVVLRLEKRTEVSGAMSDFGLVTLLSAARCAGRDVTTRFPVLKTRAAALPVPWGCLPRRVQVLFNSSVQCSD
jgi:hypothetical protein